MSLDPLSVAITVAGLAILTTVGRWLNSYWRADKKLVKRRDRSSGGVAEVDRLTSHRRRFLIHAIYILTFTLIVGTTIYTGSVVPNGPYLIIVGLISLIWFSLILFETKENFDTAQSRKEEIAAEKEDGATTTADVLPMTPPKAANG